VPHWKDTSKNTSRSGSIISHSNMKVFLAQPQEQSPQFRSLYTWTSESKILTRTSYTSNCHIKTSITTRTHVLWISSSSENVLYNNQCLMWGNTAELVLVAWKCQHIIYIQLSIMVIYNLRVEIISISYLIVGT
jgi:hypothetical protein